MLNEKCCVCGQPATCFETEEIECEPVNCAVKTNGVLPDGSKMLVERMAKVKTFKPGALKVYCDTHAPQEEKAK